VITRFCLVRDESGSTIVEFGILAPIIVAMMLGVLHVGLGVQSYNAVRHVASDTARHAMIQFGNGAPMTNLGLENYANNTGEAAPYLLTDTRLTATVTDVTTPRVARTFEKTLTITYQMPTLFEDMGLNGPLITFSRPIIVTNS
jgi:Flp pilus assembly protein TadG